MAISRKEIILASLFSLVVFAIQPYLTVAAGLAFLLLIFILIEKKYYPSIIVVSFLVVTSTIDQSLRSALNILSILLLSYLYLEKYGITLTKIKEIPIKVLISFGLILLSLAISTILSSAVSTGLSWIIMQVEFFVIVYLLFSLISIEEDIYLYSNSIIAAAIITGLGLMVSFLTSPQDTLILISTGMTHEEGFTGNPAGSANLIVIASLQVIFYLMQKPDKKYRVFLKSILIFFALTLLLTNSRAAILGFGVSILFMLFIAHKKYFKKAIGYILVIAVIAFISTSFLDIFSSYFRITRIFENTRYVIWDITFKIIEQNPIFGIGPGAFKYHMYNNINVMIGSWEEAQLRFVYDNAGTGHSHNFFLFKASELGLFGLSVSIFFLGVIFYLAGKLINYFPDDDKRKKYVSMIAAALLGLLVRGLFEATGILTYGWITRDLPIWLLFINLIYLYSKHLRNSNNEKHLLP